MRTLVFALLASASLIGCHIEINEDLDADPSGEGENWEERAASVCDPYCIDLISCGALSDSAFGSCRDLCLERFEEDEEAVTEGCACVESAACAPEEANACEGAPLSDVFESGNHSGGSSGSSNETPGTPEPPSTPEPPETPEPPVECVASCQCDEGMACEEGYCKAPAAPVVECESDCDCTSGEACMDGVCQ